MTHTQYLIQSILAYLGLFCGLFVGYIAKEELKQGKEYLTWLMHLTFISILAVFFYYNQSIVFFISIAGLLILLSFSKERETLYYYALAIIMYLAYIYNGFIIIAPLIFIYGFPIGSIFLEANTKEPWQKNINQILIKYSGFLILSIILSIIQIYL